ncbi:hypothetical protein SG34_016015 [Thalassomonas viridans]|uniref:Uncharacterized protein n=1 Tax=Thalassomonas viridans TaxID=137584 RepID=A0AAE9YYK7_9GAMM|nr:hypothetical protein [Thalassomonas viridans]WDE02947.1 hypothetical protein SG34_016015 [Thalassomonas viridans]
MQKHPLMDKAESSLRSGLTSDRSPARSRLKKSRRRKNARVTNDKYPHLVSDLYAVSHFDPLATDQTIYGPSSGHLSVSKTIDLNDHEIVNGGPVNIMTFATDSPEYMWQVGTDRVSYVKVADWTVDSHVDALSEASGKFEPLTKSNFDNFIESADQAGATNADMMAVILETNFNNYAERFGNGLYAVVSAANILYVQYGTNINAYHVVDNDNKKSIQLCGQLPNAIDAILAVTDTPNEGARFIGLSMASTGQIVATLNIGIAVIDPTQILYPNKEPRSTGGISFAPFETSQNPLFDSNNEDPDNYHTYESITNSVSIDEDDGIYVASTVYSQDGNSSLGFIRKLVLDNDNLIIDDGEDNTRDMGAWTASYETSLHEDPPAIKTGRGSGSTPALMQVGDELLVVITDGAKQMNIAAFWALPTDAELESEGYAGREAGKRAVTCGLSNPTSRWIQSEQSVVVHDRYAFVVNNLSEGLNDLPPDALHQKSNSLLQVCLVGPSFEAPTGAEKLMWNETTTTDYPGYQAGDPEKRTGEWSSIWTRDDVASTSMVPIYSGRSNRVFISGWEGGLYGEPGAGWVLRGLDWRDGEPGDDYVLNFGSSMLGNGAYSLSQFLSDGSLVLNSIVGPIKVTDT